MDENTPCILQSSTQMHDAHLINITIWCEFLGGSATENLVQAVTSIRSRNLNSERGEWKGRELPSAARVPAAICIQSGFLVSWQCHSVGRL